MATVTDTPKLEQLFARGRARAQLRADGRERAVEAAHGDRLPRSSPWRWPLFVPSPALARSRALVVLVVAYVIACRAQFDIADGYTVPTELVLVPMLFLLPTPVVPLVVSVSWVLGRLLDYASGRTSVYRAFHVFGDCWHAVGPGAGADRRRRPGLLLGRLADLRRRPAGPVRLRLRRDRAAGAA